jgi:Na+/H+ antiporter NhaA
MDERPAKLDAADFLKEDQQGAPRALEDVCRDVQTPARRLEHTLHPCVLLVIVPVLTPASAGGSFDGNN